MKKIPIIAMAIIAAISSLGDLGAQAQYNNQKAILTKAESLAKDNPALCTFKIIGKTPGGKDVAVLTIGSGDKDNKPGIAIIGGVEGSHNLGRELALGFSASVLKDAGSDDVKALLNKVTFYVFPDVNPDATDAFFASVRYEKNVNDRQTDDDRDFLNDEDPCEDLNNDGLITLIRVTDPTGTYIESDDDKRVMVQADLSKGQLGSFLVYTEGTDNDKDEKFNEDGLGGVNFNRNLSYNYEEFGLNAGLHPASEPEVKAVLDFLFDHYNIYATFSFGPQDNLGQPMRASERPAGAGQAASPAAGTGMGPMAGPPTGAPAGGGGQMRMTGDRRITSIMRSDETINKLVSDKYHEITGVKGAPQTKTAPGNFMEWSYFHYGRYSFSTPAWWFPVERDKNPEVAFLKYAADNKMEDVFVPWTEIRHPDFPGKKTEVGGIKPFAMINPPASMLDDLIAKNYKFIKTIAAMHPDLEFLDIKTENPGDNVYRLSLKVHNSGIFATLPEAGEMNSFTRLMRISLDLAPGQKIVSGQKVQRMQRLEGDKSASFSWLIMGKGSVKVTAGAINTGIISTNAELK